jgi:hypothetical protein
MKDKMVRVSSFTHSYLKSQSNLYNITIDDFIHILRAYFESVNIIKNKKKNTIIFDIQTRYNAKFKLIKNEDYMLNINSLQVIDYENEQVVENIIEKDLIIISSEVVHVHFDYPLSRPVIFDYENENGFSRIDILRCIHEGYSRIYEEELETGKLEDKQTTFRDNRPRSNGKYGIWGHYLKDLWIEGIVYNELTNEVMLDIGS